MRVIINPAMGYLAIPFIVLAGAAYLGIVSFLLRRKQTVQHEEPSVSRKAA